MLCVNVTLCKSADRFDRIQALFTADCLRQSLPPILGKGAAVSDHRGIVEASGFRLVVVGLHRLRVVIHLVLTQNFI